MEVLAELLKYQVGQLLNRSSLSKKIQVTIPTISRWIETLERFYYCFSIKPWYTNISRSLIKEPKIYLWDWSHIKIPGMKVENFIASHLLKAIHLWNDLGRGDYELFFIRDKDQCEVDFLVTKNSHPWFLVEVKSSSKTGISKDLYKFQKQTKAEHAFQVVFDLPYVEKNCFEYKDPIIVPAQTFLSQLV
jgi:predicted AAA+ superfamily ATPase